MRTDEGVQARTLGYSGTADSISREILTDDAAIAILNVNKGRVSLVATGPKASAAELAAINKH